MITASGTPKILDFGVARLRPEPQQAGTEAATITTEGKFFGTLS